MNIWWINYRKYVYAHLLFLNHFLHSGAGICKCHRSLFEDVNTRATSRTAERSTNLQKTFWNTSVFLRSLSLGEFCYSWVTLVCTNETLVTESNCTPFSLSTVLSMDIWVVLAVEDRAPVNIGIQVPVSYADLILFGFFPRSGAWTYGHSEKLYNRVMCFISR